MQCSTLRFFVLVALLTAGCLGNYRTAWADGAEVLAETARFFPSNGVERAAFGASVSLDGDRFVVGAYLEEAAYIFEKDANGSWIETARLVSDVVSFSSFGSSVALENNIVVVGAHYENPHGKAYVFERNVQGVWEQIVKLTPLDANYEWFGGSVSIDGSRIAIGAPGNSIRDIPANAYVFERDAEGNWLQSAKLIRSDGRVYDNFGTDISLDGDRVAVGAYGYDVEGAEGAVYIFERSPSGDWIETHTFVAPNGRKGIGDNVSLQGNRIAMGAHEEASRSGAVYVSERNENGNWIPLTRLAPANLERRDAFGQGVAFDADHLAVGAAVDTDGGAGPGAVYLFERQESGSWIEIDTLRLIDETKGNKFGGALSFDAGRLLVGAIGTEEFGRLSGSAHLFETIRVSPQLVIEGTCPGEIALTSSEVTPQNVIGLYSSAALGTFTLESGSCAGTVLDLDSASRLSLWTTNFDASGTVFRTVNEDQCGTYLQLLDRRTCLASTVVRVPDALSSPAVGNEQKNETPTAREM